MGKIPITWLPKGTTLMHQRWNQKPFPNGASISEAPFAFYSVDTPYYAPVDSMLTYVYKTRRDISIITLSTTFWPEDLDSALGLEVEIPSYADSVYGQALTKCGSKIDAIGIKSNTSWEEIVITRERAIEACEYVSCIGHVV